MSKTLTKTELIKALNSWETEQVFFDDGEKYFQVVEVVRGMGKGIIVRISSKGVKQ